MHMISHRINLKASWTYELIEGIMMTVTSLGGCLTAAIQTLSRLAQALKWKKNNEIINTKFDFFTIIYSNHIFLRSPPEELLSYQLLPWSNLCRRT